MQSRDLKTAVILTAMCLLLSLGLSYSYVHAWFLTQGVVPLALTIALVLCLTAILEFVRTPSEVKYYLGHPAHGLGLLLLISTDKYVSARLKARRSQHSKILSHAR